MEKRAELLVVADRGGHLHDALRLIDQMGVYPDVLVTTEGPDVDALKKESLLGATLVCTVPLTFFWIGKRRIFSPLRFFKLGLKSFLYCVRFRPRMIISTGAANVVPLCLFAKLFGGTLIHIENLAQVKNASLTGRMLYPCADYFFVQWEDLLKAYGPKAQYAGWVL